MSKTKQIRNAQKQRSRISQTFAAMNTHALTPADVLERTPPCLNRLRVFDVIRRFPRIDSDGAEKVLKKARVWPLTRMGDLTPEQRDAIVSHLPARAKEY